MSIYIGDKEIKDLCIGDGSAKEVYLGDIKVRPKKPKERDIDITNFKNITQYSISGQQGSAFSYDGKNFYIATSRGSRDCYQYILDTPYDLSSYTEVKTAQLFVEYAGTRMDDGITQLYISPDGSKIACTSRPSGRQGMGVTIYDLSTPFDITTKTNKIFDRLGGGGGGVWFSPEGKYVYYNGITEIRQYELNTNWDITNVTQVNTISLTYGYCVSLSPEGDYIIYYDNGTVYQKKLQTKWDLGSVTDYKSTTGYSRPTISLDGSHFMNECTVAEFYEKTS